MAKSKVPVPSILALPKYLKPESILPVYFLFGDDTYSIENSARSIENAVQPLLASDFDKEVLSAKDRSLTECLDLAMSFPFGSEKKLIIFKDYEDRKEDRKKLAAYVKNPSSFTVLLIIRNGGISNLEAEPYLTLLKENYIFEAKELKGQELSAWIIKYAKKKGKTISSENADMLLNIVGENRSLIEMQLQKIFAFLGDREEITLETIRSLSSALKEFNIFDLQNAVAERNRKKAFEMAYNLLDQGKEPLFITAMLTRYFTGLAQVPELEKSGLTDQEAAKIVGTHPYYYKDYRRASIFFQGKRMHKVARALFNADLALKSTQTDPKTIISILLTEILT